MNLHDLVLRNRSYRRFDNGFQIQHETLLELVDLARLSASGRNMQSLRYILSYTVERNELIFPCLAWAGYLKDWPGPDPHERPTAYLVMLNDTEISTNYFWDHGIAVQSILLGAVEKGLGGCIIASVKKEQLRQVLSIHEKYEIIQVIALGKPVEKVVVEPLAANGDIKYWRDSNKVHHVPKRSLRDLIIEM
ncbi:MAG: nitroreductase family protein [Bacteroidales bacterium]